MAIMGRREAVEKFCGDNGLELLREMNVFSEILSTTSAGIAEVVIPPDSSLIGKSLREIGLRQL